MFDFRLIDMPDGSQIIDRSLKTPYNTLTAIQMVEYNEVDIQLAIMDKLERQAKRKTDKQRKYVKNPFYRLACICGIF